MARFLIVLLCFLCGALANESTKVYIVYLGASKGRNLETLVVHHHGILAEATGSLEMASQAMVYNYKHAFSGFAARLTDEQARSIAGLPGVIHVYPSQKLKLHTTRSWDFLGLTEPAAAFSRAALPKAEGDIIIGLLDTGIWPESKSFRDDGLGPVPSRWKGQCVNPPRMNSSDHIRCNRKIVGARYYNADLDPKDPVVYKNARDSWGHGTHTSSTAAGRLVSNVSANSFPSGTARGGAPQARIAMYKVCWTSDCGESDILAAFDDAVHDGVDIISISIGGDPSNYNVDTIAIGAFHAVRQGVLVAASAGNSGEGRVANAAPWFLTVGASTIDRKRGQPIPFKPAPVVPYFSSTGPNSISLDIIKPDITAPGVDIVAAWPSNMGADYAVLSGTSMACPHAAGAVAYVKSKFPSWSQAAIKSALMTTATTVDNTNHTIGSAISVAPTFSFGSGLIQPTKAIDPGLVYDNQPSDYVNYLCSTGYTTVQVQNITGDKSDQCSDKPNVVNLNYPSIGVANLTGSLTVVREVTNVGPSGSVYKVEVEEPSDEGLSIVVKPMQLNFTSQGEKQTYEVTVTATRKGLSKWVFSSLTWLDGVHTVRSPVAVLVL